MIYKTLTFASIACLLIDVGVTVSGNYQYSKNYGSYWSLAEKASSIEKKIEGIDKFVDALEHANMSGKHDALFMDTPDNGFDENFEALKSLQLRLHEIKEMDIKSFEYQTALQQITQQEQTEAGEMLSVFSGIWWKENHFMLWNWVGLVQVCALLAVIFVCVAIWSSEY